jgi:hypothetical protein
MAWLHMAGDQGETPADRAYRLHERSGEVVRGDVPARRNNTTFDHRTPENAGTRFGRGDRAAGGTDINVRVRQLRAWIADFRETVADLERELEGLLAARGSRPGDGSDQPRLWETDVQSKLL